MSKIIDKLKKVVKGLKETFNEGEEVEYAPISVIAERLSNEPNADLKENIEKILKDARAGLDRGSIIKGKESKEINNIPVRETTERIQNTERTISTPNIEQNDREDR